MTDIPEHFWDFMEDGDFAKFTDKECKTSRRWLAQITYNDGTPGQSITFEELSELHDIIECGPDWNALHKIVVTLNRKTA